MRPLLSEWPLWSEVRTILPLKTLALCASCREEPAQLLVLFGRVRVLRRLFKQACSARPSSPPILTFWHPVCCSLVRCGAGLNHQRGVYECVCKCVCTRAWSVYVCVRCGGTVCCATVMPLKQVRVLREQHLSPSLSPSLSPLSLSFSLSFVWGRH